MSSSHSKRYQAAREKVEAERAYPVDEALALVKELASAGFDETVEVAIKLGVQAGKGDQNVRGTVVLPHGTGKVPRVAVFAEGEAVREAEAAGADRIGGEDLVKAIQDGWDEFDILVAQPSMMKIVGPLGKKLGPRMPSKKAGNVTDDVASAVAALKSGRAEFKIDRGGVLHVPIGKVSYEVQQLRENFDTLLDAVLAARPSSLTGRYIQNIVVSSSMGPGVKVDVAEATSRAA
ncbi:MAG: 50S ribosomal protein L1 [Armatimonadetes bacterium]|nr:50S ribosomal protein L1 [Armatimonadota bacterium]